jgi:1-deoxy-D-xylulose-5-phosphate reductoisomerase
LHFPKRHIAILGSTGSIGTQALDVVAANAELFEIEVLSAQNNADLLIQQAAQFRPNLVVIGNENLYDQVFAALDPLDIKVYAGAKALADVVQMDCIEVVLTSMVGYAGLIPTLKAIEAGKHIALANKETLVVAGDLVTAAAAEKGVNIYPVDSEHSAIFQCLVGEFHNPIEKIILTASGGPFRGKTRDDLMHVTKAQALKHPNWSMGAKITIDSASMMNKGLEVIEAKWLFGLKPSQIEVVVHPQSIVHSMVQFADSSIKAQMGLPDMRVPIQFALSYPHRIKADFPRLDFANYPSLTFEQPDLQTFRNLQLAYEALNRGGNLACIVNAANEVAVAAFLEDKIGFLQMSDLIETCMQRVTFIQQPTLNDYIETDAETRRVAVDNLKTR